MRTPLFLVLVALTATSAAAHDTWLLPRPAAPAGMLELELTSARAASGPDADWRSWFATLTFELGR